MMSQPSAYASGQPPEPLDPQEVYDSLQTVLDDEETFQKTVDRVFSGMQPSRGRIGMPELTSYMNSLCESFGIATPPTSSQVHHVFRHLDLDGDRVVSREELGVFLRHLFTEHKYQAAEKIARIKAQAATKSKQQAVRDFKSRLKAGGGGHKSVKRGSSVAYSLGEGGGGTAGMSREPSVGAALWEPSP